mmetsp:Transcript_4706/g.7230  ORF Transcript_4706/g.7230 Transcript_4706/m.7230 type:complete len:112 (+) Transcript_4706:152-487(+)
MSVSHVHPSQGMATTFPVGVTNSGGDRSNAFTMSQHEGSHHMSSAQPPSSHNLPPNDVCAGCKRSGLNLLVCDDCVTSGVDVSGRGNTKQRCVGNCRWVDRGGLGFSLVDM